MPAGPGPRARRAGAWAAFKFQSPARPLASRMLPLAVGRYQSASGDFRWRFGRTGNFRAAALTEWYSVTRRAPLAGPQCVLHANDRNLNKVDVEATS
jgi:hypothetical protein